MSDLARHNVNELQNERLTEINPLLENQLDQQELIVRSDQETQVPSNQINATTIDEKLINRLATESNNNYRERFEWILLCIILIIIISALCGGQYYINNYNSNAISNENLEKIFRLPSSIKPIHYTLNIITFLEPPDNLTFHGNVTILMDVIENCSTIRLHAHELNITDDGVTLQNAVSYENYSIAIQIKTQEQQMLISRTESEFIAGEKYQLTIKFHGPLNKYMKGFYRSSYRQNNKTKWLAVTQMQPSDARRVFPCFDEPIFKATFDIRIGHKSGTEALSNMNSVSQVLDSNDDTYIWDRFAITPKMSTYLVAIVITDFKKFSFDKFNVWTEPNKINSSHYALELASKLLYFFEEYFQVNYPLPKLDLIGVPDFPSGAMENWGLIIFRESQFLYEPNVSPITTKQFIALIIAHEIAHQWFGNLVTPEWWSDLWLNEGFATYMELVAINAIEPSFEPYHRFVAYMQESMANDAYNTSHKISQELHRHEQLSLIFDSITYTKSAAILRMMNNFLTTDVHTMALKKLLNERSYSNINQNDLWAYLTEAAKNKNIEIFLNNNISVKDIMDSWTLQIGFPLVTLTRNDDWITGQLKQERFVSDMDAAQNVTSLWYIPITYTTSEELNFMDKQPKIWMNKVNEMSFNISEFTNRTIDEIEKSWILLNVNQIGYYRVNYDLNNWNNIIEHLKNNKRFHEISPINRAQLIDDSLALANSGYINYDIAFRLLSYLRHETHIVPWRSTIYTYSSIDSMLLRDTNYKLLQKFMWELIQEVFTQILHSKPETPEEISRKSDIFQLGCHLSYTNCVLYSHRLFGEWKQLDLKNYSINPIPADLQPFIYCSAIKFGAKEDWDFLWNHYLNETAAIAQQAQLFGLSCSIDKWTLHKYLHYALEGIHIRKQDFITVFIAVSNNAIGRDVVFAFIRSKFKEIHTYLGGTTNDMIILFKFCFDKFNTNEELEMVNKLITDHLPSTPDADQILEKINLNIRWMNKHYKTIIDWLSEFHKNKEFISDKITLE